MQASYLKFDSNDTATPNGGAMNLLLTSEAARILNRSAEMVRVYEKSGKLPAVKIGGGRRLFKERDVRRLADELARKSPLGAPR